MDLVLQEINNKDIEIGTVVFNLDTDPDIITTFTENMFYSKDKNDIDDVKHFIFCLANTWNDISGRHIYTTYNFRLNKWESQLEQIVVDNLWVTLKAWGDTDKESFINLLQKENQLIEYYQTEIEPNEEEE